MNDWCSAPLQVCTPGTLRSWLLDPFLCQAAVVTLATRAVPHCAFYARLAVGAGRRRGRGVRVLAVACARWQL